MQRIFKYGAIQNIVLLSPDKERLYWTPSYVIIYRSHTL